MPTSFSGKQFSFIQPDGTVLQVRGWGNQYHATFETLDGYTVVRDPVSGFYQYADVSAHGDDLIPTGARPTLVDPKSIGLTPGLRVSTVAAKAKAREGSGLIPGSSRWEQRRRQFKQALHAAVLTDGVVPAPPSRGTVGDYLGLCLLVDFPDVPATIARDDVDDFCNKSGYTGYGNNGSVYDYFLEISAGRLRYKNVVTPYFTAKHPLSYYTSESVPYPDRARELVTEALEYHRANGFDFTKLTADDEQYVYAVNVFYAGPCVNTWKKGLWPHSSSLLTPFALTQGKNAFDYQITNISLELSIGTFCHENGHMICDFPDLYDYGGESSGVGVFCLMCDGPNADEKNPPHVGAYLKYKAGWAQVLTKITAGLVGTAVAASNRFYIHRRNATEYYLIENRFRAGRDQALPASGLAIWHIDELGDNEREQMTPAFHYECALMQADGRNDLERDPKNIGDATDLFSREVNGHFGVATTPNSSWWDQAASGLDIGSIGPVGQQMAFLGNV
jgi:M6 family metalloprotease-like protein